MLCGPTGVVPVDPIYVKVMDKMKSSKASPPDLNAQFRHPRGQSTAVDTLDVAQEWP